MTRVRSSRRWSAAPPAGVRTARCSTSTASPTTSSRRRTPSGGAHAGTTSTPSTCASTAARCSPTRRPTTPPTCTTTSPSWTRPGSGSAWVTHVVVLSGHSTGGLTVPLWADERRIEARGIVLNAPWFDLQGSILVRHALDAGRHAARAAPAEARHPAHGDRVLRPQPAPRPRGRVGLRPGLEADRVVAGVRRVAGRRSGGAMPSSTPGSTSRSRRWCSRASRRRPRREMGDDVHRHDIVLDVEQIRRWSPALGRHVTYVGDPGCTPRRVLVARGAARGRLRRARAVGPRVRRLRPRRQSLTSVWRISRACSITPM